MEWSEVSITVNREAVEAVTSFIHDMGVNVSIYDPADVKDLKSESDWVIVDDSLISSDIENVIIKAYFLSKDVKEKIIVIKNQLIVISKYIDVGKYKISICSVNQEDWENEWKKYYKPIKVGERVVIKPSWEYYKSSEHDIVVELDPGMAFGTGTHESTRMCIKLLEKFIKCGDSVFDVGCGSGILSICASKLGALEIVAVDVDPIAISSTITNTSINNISNIEVLEGTIDVIDKAKKADIIIANIVADVIINIAESVKDYLLKDGIFICSGIVKDRLFEVNQCFSKKEFEVLSVATEGEWVAIAFKNKGI